MHIMHLKLNPEHLFEYRVGK